MHPGESKYSVPPSGVVSVFAALRLSTILPQHWIAREIRGVITPDACVGIERILDFFIEFVTVRVHVVSFLLCGGQPLGAPRDLSIFHFPTLTSLRSLCAGGMIPCVVQNGEQRDGRRYERDGANLQELHRRRVGRGGGWAHDARTAIRRPASCSASSRALARRMWTARWRRRKAAFEGWRRTPAPKRGEMLYRVGALLAERKEEIARILTSEMGKVLVEARGDVQEAIDMAYYMAGEGRRLFGAIVPSELPNKAAYGVRDPLGVIACITPWNFPIAIPSWKTHGRAHRRQHRRPQAGDRYAALGAVNWSRPSPTRGCRRAC